jgi:hypothetical protein
MMRLEPTPENVALWLLAAFCIDCGGPLGPRRRFHCPSCYLRPKCGPGGKRAMHAFQWAEAIQTGSGNRSAL